MATNFKHSLSSFVKTRYRNKYVAAIVVIIHFVVFVYVKTADHHVIAPVTDLTLAEAIAVRASQDRYILLAMADEAYVDVAINFYEGSLKPYHINNYLFVGVGNSTCDVLKRQSIACFFYTTDCSAFRDSSFGTTDFIRKMNIRTDMILDALGANFTVIHSDVDVCFLSNPLKEIKVSASFKLFFICK